MAGIGTLNAKIADRGIELVKGRGYFYFAILPNFPDDTPIPDSVFVPRFTDMTFNQWLDCAA
jgi:hypothetical protein